MKYISKFANFLMMIPCIGENLHFEPKLNSWKFKSDFEMVTEVELL